MSGNWFSSRTSSGPIRGTEVTFSKSYCDSLAGDSSCSSIRSVVTLICRGKLSESGLGIEFLTKVTSMLAWPVKESCLECPNLNTTLERLVDGSVPPVPGLSGFDHEMKSGAVFGAPSCGPEYCNVTQYTARAFIMT